MLFVAAAIAFVIAVIVLDAVFDVRTVLFVALFGPMPVADNSVQTVLDYDIPIVSSKYDNSLLAGSSTHNLPKV